MTYTPGMVLDVRLQVTGTSPTTLNSMVWADGTTQPTTWQATATDSTAGLQVAGAVSLITYLSGSATNAPENASFSSYWAGPTHVSGSNIPPTAAFSSVVVQSGCKLQCRQPPATATAPSRRMHGTSVTARRAPA